MKNLLYKYFFVLCVIAMPVHLFAYDFCVDGIYYRIVDGGVAVTYSGTETAPGSAYTQSDLIIPDIVTYSGAEYDVIKIDERAFYNCRNLKTIVVPNSIYNIGQGAFSGCSGLISMTIPFAGSGVGGIGQNGLLGYVFGQTADDEMQRTMQYYNNNSTMTSYLPVSLETVTITNGTKINYGSFNYCKGIKSIVLPESVETVSSKAFAGCTQLQEINLDQVRIIEANAFDDTDLINACIPNVESIGNYAFDGCKKIKNIIFSDKITNIGEGAFRDCTSLSTLTLPVSVKSIGRGAFSGCDSLNEVYVEWSTPLALNSSILDDGVTVYVPRGCRTKYRQADFWRALNIKVKSLPLSELVLFEDPMVKSICIKYWDTDEDEELSKAEAASVTSLERIFSVMGQSKITIFNELQYFTGLQSIDGSAFYNCSSLNSVVLPLCIKSVDSKAFYGTGLNGQLVIPDGVTDIGENAFYGCSNIKSIVFPSTCLFVGKAAFSNCTSLDTVLYLGTRQQWQSINILDDNDNLKDAHIVYEYGTLHQFEEFEQDKIRYVVTDLATRKLSVVEKPDKYKGTVIIPNVVSYFGVDYYVSGIADGAFENCNDIDSILYEGTRVQWQKLSIGLKNEILQAVPIRYAFESTGNTPHDNYVYIPETSIPFAGNGTLSVCLRNQVPVTGYQFELELPAGVSIVTDSDACQASVSNDRTTLSDHNIFEVSKLKNGRYLVICASTKNSVFSGTDGAVATIDVTISNSVEAGECPVKIYNQVITGPTGVLDRIDVSDFSFEIAPFELGDANGDGIVNISDAIGIANYILGTSTNVFNEQCADVNSDGIITISDFIGVCNIILYGSVTGRP